jgi:hypothetical protein
MADTIAFTKVSGVITVTSGTNPPKSFFGLSGYYNTNSSNDGFIIQIGTTNLQVSLTDLRVNGQNPSTMTTARTLLNSIFGT